METIVFSGQEPYEISTKELIKNVEAAPEELDDNQI